MARNSVIRRVALASTGAVLALLAACSDDGAGAAPTDRANEKLEEGLALHTEGKLEDAAAKYREVIDIDAGNAFGYYNLGLVEQTKGESTKAQEHYRQALDRDPRMAPALFNLAILRTSDEAFDEAVSLYQQVNALAPDNAAAHLNLGLLLQQMGRDDEADREIDRATQIDPSLESRLKKDG